MVAATPTPAARRRPALCADTPARKGLKEAALARAGGLVPELVVANLREVNEPSDLLHEDARMLVGYEVEVVFGVVFGVEVDRVS